MLLGVPPETQGSPTVVPSDSTTLPGTRISLVHMSDSPEGAIGVAEMLIERVGLKKAEVARRMGIRPQTLQQYLAKRVGSRKRGKKYISLQWFLRIVHVCGARLVVEMPPIERVVKE